MAELSVKWKQVDMGRGRSLPCFVSGRSSAGITHNTITGLVDTDQEVSSLIRMFGVSAGFARGANGIRVSFGAAKENDEALVHILKQANKEEGSVTVTPSMIAEAKAACEQAPEPAAPVRFSSPAAPEPIDW